MKTGEPTISNPSAEFTLSKAEVLRISLPSPETAGIYIFTNPKGLNECDVLKRIYIDNFRCFVNFELCVDSINLFLGPNGTGKSTIFDVLRKIQAFVSGDDKATTLFKPDDLTRWQTSPIQTFELDIEGNGGTYKYELAIEHDEAQRHPRVTYERLWFDNNPLLKFEGGKVQLYEDDYSEGPTVPFPPGLSQSVVAFLSSDTKLNWFRKRMERFIVVQINPMLMVGESGREESQLTARMENFVSWYRYVSQENW